MVQVGPTLQLANLDVPANHAMRTWVLLESLTYPWRGASCLALCFLIVRRSETHTPLLVVAFWGGFTRSLIAPEADPARPAHL